MTESRRLSPGDRAPEFTLPDADGTPTSLQDLLAEHGRVLVYVYPAAMTPGCTTQACDFRDSLPALAAQGTAVLGISRDSVAKLAEATAADSIPYPLLSDEDKLCLDLWYVDHASRWLDLRILALTPLRTVEGRNAY